MIKVYDNNGETLDRYIILFMDEKEGNLYRSLSLSYDPAAANGCAIHSQALDGDHLGRLIRFMDLPYRTRQFCERFELNTVNNVYKVA